MQRTYLNQMVSATQDRGSDVAARIKSAQDNQAHQEEGQTAALIRKVGGQPFQSSASSSSGRAESDWLGWQLFRARLIGWQQRAAKEGCPERDAQKARIERELLGRDR